jgi:hypothetical protein
MAQFEDLWKVLQEEYKTVREESKQAELNTFAALQWGATLIAFAAGAGLTQWGVNNRGAVVVTAFVLLIPVFSVASFYLWLGEALRMKRAGDYLCIIEARVEASFEADTKKWSHKQQMEAEAALGLAHGKHLLQSPLNWERWLRSSRRSFWDLKTSGGHEPITQAPRFMFFPLIAGLSWSVGTYYWWYVMGSAEPGHDIPLILVSLPLVATLVYGMMIALIVSLSYGVALVFYQFVRVRTRGQSNRRAEPIRQ